MSASGSGSRQQLPEYILDRVRRAPPAGHSIVAGSTPVVSFGNPYTAKVATLGLNPSAREFHGPDGLLLTGSALRLQTLASLGVTELAGADEKTVARVVDACYGYFTANPFWEFFGHMSPLLQAAGTSYRAGSACHLDLVQWATDPLWAAIRPTRARERLLREDAEFLRTQLADTGLQLVLVNGNTAVKQVAAVGGSWTERNSLPAGHGDAWLLRGEMAGVPLLGWTPFLPRGFVSAARRQVIIQAIAESAAHLDPTAGSQSKLTADDESAQNESVRAPASRRAAITDDREWSRVDLYLLTTDGVAVGLLVVADKQYVLVHTDELDANTCEARMRAAWGPDGAPDGAPELAILRRALAAMPASADRHLLRSVGTVEQALDAGLPLLGQMIGPSELHAYRWPEGRVEPLRAVVGDRAELLHALTGCEEAQVWSAATAAPWITDGPPYVRHLGVGWQSDVLTLAQQHRSGNVRDLALHETGYMSPYALARPTGELGYAEALYLAGQPWTSPERVQELANRYGREIRLRILRRPDRHPAVLRQLAADRDEAVAEIALADPLLPAAALVDLLYRLPERRAAALALHERLPLADPRVLDAALPHSVRQAVLHRHDLPMSVLERLGSSEDPAQRSAAAARCSTQTAGRLLDDSNDRVRRAAAGNPNFKGIAELALARNDLVLLTEAARRDDLAAEQARRVCEAIISHRDADDFEIASAIRRPGLGAAALSALLADPMEPSDVAAAALTNPACPEQDVLRHLADPDPQVRCAALQAVLERELYVSSEMIDAAKAAPLRLRALRPGVHGYEAPMDCVGPLVSALRADRGLDDKD